MVRIITDRALDKLKAEIKIDVLETFKASFKEFTDDVVGCLNNHLQGFSGVLSQRPCEQYTMDIETLKAKYLDHEKRITILESEIKQSKTKN